jgi:hypothetical protein
MLAAAIKAGVVGSLVIEETTFGAFTVVGGLVTFLGRMRQEVASFALFHRFRFPGNADGDLFTKKEVARFDDLLDLISGVVIYYDGHSVGFSFGIFYGST